MHKPINMVRKCKHALTLAKKDAKENEHASKIHHKK
jgi:hypothetical protein